MRRLRYVVSSVVLLAAAMGTVAVPAQAYDPTIAFWDMDAPAGSTALVDKDGHGVNGSIGSDIRLGNVDAEGATFFKWAYSAPNATPADAPRRISVTGDATNPGTRDFTIALRYRTTKTFGNVIQKGQNGNVGGYWKVELPKGHVTCLFKGVQGSVLVNSSVELNDGQWHTIVCSRTASGATMVIDGATTRHKSGVSGSISNKIPVSIGGKVNCDQVAVTCDFFTGDIDWIKLSSP